MNYPNKQFITTNNVIIELYLTTYKYNCLII